MKSLHFPVKGLFLIAILVLFVISTSALSQVSAQAITTPIPTENQFEPTPIPTEFFRSDSAQTFNTLSLDEPTSIDPD